MARHQNARMEEAARRSRVVESWATLRTVSPSVGLVVDEEAEARVCECVRVGVGEGDLRCDLFVIAETRCREE